MKKKSKIGSLLKMIFLLLNVFFAFFLIGSLLAGKINPEKNCIPAFLGLMYPVLLYINVGFALIWLFMRKRWFFISLFAIIAGYNTLPKYFQCGFIPKKYAQEQTFTIVSFNVQSFRTFYYHESQEYLDSIALFLKSLNPHIICFQEYYNDLESDKNIMNFLKKSLDMDYNYVGSRLLRDKRYQFGLAVISKFPITDTGKILNINYEVDDFSTTNYAIYTDINIDKDTFRLYNVHLESFKISEDENIINYFESGIMDEIKKGSLKELLSRLKTAFIFRSRQLQIIREHINNSPYPVIVCGDFNDTPASWAYAQMSKGLQDAFVIAGRGTGKTYVGRYPSLRIDYILTDEKINIHKFDVPDVIFSEHYPIYAVCSVKKTY